MPKIALITSIDYELFGDGSGNVKREQINPTNNLLQIARLYGVKLTIMFEYAQYIVYEKFGQEYPHLLKENQLIKSQLISFIKEGHDVQLHYHAQWENAIYNDSIKNFTVNLDTIDISTLEYKRIVEILSDGKIFLENLLKPHNYRYECIGFRAGSWAVSNQNKLLKALKYVGFKSDSSVVPNVKFESEQVNFEYGNCPHKYHYWYVNNYLSKEDISSTFIEIPIYTEKSPYGFLKYLNSKYLQSRKIVSQFYKVKISEKNFSLLQKIKKIFSRNYYMADLNTMSAKTLIKMVEEALNNDQFTNEEIIPIMFISHSKTSYALDDLHTFYTYLKIHYPHQIEYWTYQEAIEYILKDKND